MGECEAEAGRAMEPPTERKTDLVGLSVVGLRLEREVRGGRGGVGEGAGMLGEGARGGVG